MPSRALRQGISNHKRRQPALAINHVVNELSHVEQHTKSSECSAQKRSEALLNCNAVRLVRRSCYLEPRRTAVTIPAIEITTHGCSLAFSSTHSRLLSLPPWPFHLPSMSVSAASHFSEAVRHRRRRSIRAVHDHQQSRESRSNLVQVIGSAPGNLNAKIRIHSRRARHGTSSILWREFRKRRRDLQHCHLLPPSA